MMTRKRRRRRRRRTRRQTVPNMCMNKLITNRLSRRSRTQTRIDINGTPTMTKRRTILPTHHDSNGDADADADIYDDR